MSIEPICTFCGAATKHRCTTVEEAVQDCGYLVVEETGKTPIKSDGGATDYYTLPIHATELRHLISHKSMSFARGNLFKACYRLGEKEGTDVLYDLNKMKFFVEDLIEMYHRGEAV